MRRGSIAVVAAALSMVGLLFSPATAATNYDISESSGKTFVSSTSNSLFTGSVDTQVVQLSTSFGGRTHMPFAVRFYGTTKSSMWVSANGNVQFGRTISAAPWNDCLPSSVIPKKLIAVFWDDLSMDTSIPGQGVFTRTQGTAPDRRFTISWQVVRADDQTPVLAQVTFFESSNTIKMVYGQSGGASATIGVQLSSTTLSRQFSCNSGRADTVFPGLRLDFTR